MNKYLSIQTGIAFRGTLTSNRQISRLLSLRRSPIMKAKDMDKAIELANNGMISALYAKQKPDAVALYFPGGRRTFAELHERANRLANRFRDAGLQPGDGLAAFCGNGPTFVETYLAAMRIGLRLTPVNSRLMPAEAAYIIADCDARALVIDQDSGGSGLELKSLRLALCLATNAGGGFDGYEAALAAASPRDPDMPSHGTLMLYTSGTTGRPKGVFSARLDPILPQGPGTYANYDPETDVALCCGPAYHAAPLLMDIRWPLASGVPVVMMDRFDAETALQMISGHRVTHTHMVPTMFQRLLQLTQETRDAYDVSSLKLVVHGAAPCPVETKRRMIDWFGPVLTEYYSATEGGGSVIITSEEWLRKPGSVGRLSPVTPGVRVLDDKGEPCAPGQVGRVYLHADPASRFCYYKDPDKTAALFEEYRFSLGDMGYVDEDSYLFLTGRTAELIISGGVNIYPQEIDNIVGLHPAVADVCTVGAPNPEWGEEVRSVVELKDGFHPSPRLSNEILEFVSVRLSGYKRPRVIDFDPQLPRLASGKIQRGKVRQRYWQDGESIITPATSLNEKP